MPSVYLEDVRKTLLVWWGIQWDLREASQVERTALHVQSEVVSAKLRRMKSDAAQALELLRYFDDERCCGWDLFSPERER